MLTIDQARELGRCYADAIYFVANYCKIYDSVTSDWIPFALWPAQRQALHMIHEDRLVVILKARQIGLTWCCLGYALWQIIFRPIAAIGLFSRRDTESLYLMGQDRLRGMYRQLPDWMKTGHEPLVDSGHEWTLANGSAVRAFPTSAGDSYVSTLAIVDEADLAPDLNRLMRAVKPTIDNGGKLVLLSRVDKTQPESEFKRIYRAAKANQNGWSHIFLPWNVHPGRDDAWYERQKIDVESRTGSLDDLHEQYPATAEEALAPRALDKRIPPTWLQRVYVEALATNPLGIPGLSVYREPQQYADPERKLGKAAYRIGCDPAEGNPSSDDSAAIVVDERTGEEMAVLCGKLQPSSFAAYVARLAAWYNGAAVLVERNNHGHAVLLWLQDNSKATILNGSDDKAGWPTTSKSKAQMYDDFTDKVRDQELTIHSFESFMQLSSIDGSTLSAPDGMHDDRAVSFVLATLSAQLLAPQKRAGTW